jgi:hypothetical protein
MRDDLETLDVCNRARGRCVSTILRQLLCEFIEFCYFSGSENSKIGCGTITE